MSNADNGLTFSFNVCSQCKSICCQDAKPPLSERRKKIIRDFLNREKIDVQKPFAKEAYSYPAVDEQVYCRLFDKKTGKCMVHQVKPETCVAGPITFDINFATKKVEWFLKKDEICAFAGTLYSDKSGFKRHFDLAKKHIRQLIRALDAEELRVIVKIPEPQTFKVGEEDLAPEVIRKLGLK